MTSRSSRRTSSPASAAASPTDFHLRVETDGEVLERSGTTLHEMVALG